MNFWPEAIILGEKIDGVRPLITESGGYLEGGIPRGLIEKTEKVSIEVGRCHNSNTGKPTVQDYRDYEIYKITNGEYEGSPIIPLSVKVYSSKGRDSGYDTSYGCTIDISVSLILDEGYDSEKRFAMANTARLNGTSSGVNKGPEIGFMIDLAPRTSEIHRTNKPMVITEKIVTLNELFQAKRSLTLRLTSSASNFVFGGTAAGINCYAYANADISYLC